MIRVPVPPPRRAVPALAAGFLAATSVLVGAPAAGAAPTAAVISGSGSTWSQIAVQTWAADVRRSGLVVNYTGNGSSAGRTDFINGSDFAVSEIPFQPATVLPGGQVTNDELQAVRDRPYAYLPIVAGGTSFMYHVTVAGRRITDLRLSGETITKIFTGVITDWSDPQITRDYGRRLPGKRIIPIIRSDGSGTSAQFSLYMSRQYPALWNAFCQRSSLPTPCGLTSNYPPFGNALAQSGSNGVANYVHANFGEGAITYVEYGYALQLGDPVVKVLNAAGYYALPTASNVAVALTKAQINRDRNSPSYLTQQLDNVYRNTDRRTYPLSSYSYMIVPVSNARGFPDARGLTLSKYINYFLCAGQQKAEPLGYSPLPSNLVQAGFDQVARIPGHEASPALSKCNNPALRILQNAPFPPACDRVGQTCGTTSQGGGTGGTGGSSNGQQGSGGGTGGGSGATGGGTGQNSGPQGSAGPNRGRTPNSGATVDPLGDPSGPAQGSGSDDPEQAVGQAIDLARYRQRDTTRTLSTLLVAELALAFVLPPVIAVLLRRRGGRR